MTLASVSRTSEVAEGSLKIKSSLQADKIIPFFFLISTPQSTSLHREQDHAKAMAMLVRITPCSVVLAVSPPDVCLCFLLYWCKVFTIVHTR